MRIDAEKCTGCGDCVRDCPAGAVTLVKKKAVIGDACVACGVCGKVCPEAAAFALSKPKEGGIVCTACPIACAVPEGFAGACRRYENRGGRIFRLTPLHTFNDVKTEVGPEPESILQSPIITGIGAGTTYPDCKPAPRIVRREIDGVDVVTVVTEAPLSYSSVMVKVDTDHPVGDEGAAVFSGKREVGRVETEQYGSKMLHIGGVNRFTGKNGFTAARIVADIANRKPVRLKVDGGAKLSVRVGEAPIINGESPRKMRVGCGSATLGLFSPLLKEAADDVIIMDSHITGLMSEHAAGRYVGVSPSGVRIRFPISTPGRYFGDHGNGWGGTSINTPADVIEAVDMETAGVGMTILVIETTGEKGALFRVEKGGGLAEIPLTPAAVSAMTAIADTCLPARVGAIYTGGAGGSARAGVTRDPVKLTRAVHRRKARLTIGGAPVFLLPGGGITFFVDVERVKPDSFYWTPTPATICPVEYTMRLSDYEEMGGHIEAIKPFEIDEHHFP